MQLSGALLSSLNPAKFPCDGCGQLINSKGSELDISWLLSLCLIVSAAGGGDEPGTVRWIRKELGEPPSLLLPLRLLYCSPVPSGFRESGFLAEGLDAQQIRSA